MCDYTLYCQSFDSFLNMKKIFEIFGGEGSF